MEEHEHLASIEERCVLCGLRLGGEALVCARRALWVELQSRCRVVSDQDARSLRRFIETGEAAGMPWYASPVPGWLSGTEPEPLYYTSAQAAERVAHSVEDVQALACYKRLPAEKRGGRWIFARSDLQAYIEHLTYQTPERVAELIGRILHESSAASR